MTRSVRLTTILAVLVLVVACGDRNDPILRLSSEEAYTQGKALFDDGKYNQARRYLVHAFEVEPNSRLGREALLLAADAFYSQGNDENYIKCEAKYRDFLNRFPTSERAAYAQFRIGLCLAARAERPDRDQSITTTAIAAFEELLRLYPGSEYVPEARQQIVEMTDRLAEHELVVGTFYNRFGRRGICQASIGRLEYLKEEFPRFSRMDEALYQLSIGYERCRRFADAAEALSDLERRFPESLRLEEARERLPELQDFARQAEALKAQAEAAAQAAEEAQDADEEPDAPEEDEAAGGPA
ncbi:MAG: outer membrane protein assembly factor BamD [Acidobacteriota bacterium]